MEKSDIRQSSCGISQYRQIMIKIQSRRSDIVFLSKEENQCFIVDIAVPGDARIAEKEKEKIEKKSWPRSQERNDKIVEHQGSCCACDSRCSWHDSEKS